MSERNVPEGVYLDPREHSAVPRWEVRKMIAEMTAEALAKYERDIVAPRHQETQTTLAEVKTGQGATNDLLNEIKGGIKAVRWIGIGFLAVLGAGTGVAAWIKITGH